MAATNMAVYMADRRKARRNQLLEMSGGKCIQCGSNDDLNFDHKDPKERSFRLTGDALDCSWKKILDEWAKCQLLCRACHLLKTKANGEYGEPANKGMYKRGGVLPEHGSETGYAHGCRCAACCQARYDARVRRGELTGTKGMRGPTGPKGVIRHGTRSGYQKERRMGLAACEECKVANVLETRSRRQKKLMVCGEKVS